MTKKPKTKHAKVKPDNKYKGLLRVGLQCSQNVTFVIRTCIRSPDEDSERVVKAALVGAQAPGPSSVSGNAHTRLGGWLDTYPSFSQHELLLSLVLLLRQRFRVLIASSINFQLIIINNAPKSYEKLTKKNFLTHLIASRLQACVSPGHILTIIQQQIQG